MKVDQQKKSFIERAFEKTKHNSNIQKKIKKSKKANQKGKNTELTLKRNEKKEEIIQRNL